MNRRTYDHREFAAIFAGGMVGALARTAVTRWLDAAPDNWPWAVFTINVTGAFILGYFVTRLQERLPISTYQRPLIGTGFCGAFTTFSTMQVELLDMVRAHDYGLAFSYAAASIVCGYLAVFLATALTRRVRVLR